MSETGLYRGEGGIRRNKSPYFRHALFRAASDGSASRGLWSCVLSNLAVFVSHLMGNFLRPILICTTLFPNQTGNVMFHLTYIARRAQYWRHVRYYTASKFGEGAAERHTPRGEKNTASYHFLISSVIVCISDSTLLNFCFLPPQHSLRPSQPASTARRVSSLSLFFRSARVCLW